MSRSTENGGLKLGLIWRYGSRGKSCFFWPSKLVVPFAFSVLALRLILQGIGYSRALFLGLEKPAAVPLVLNAREQARLETDAIDRAK